MERGQLIYAAITSGSGPMSQAVWLAALLAVCVVLLLVARYVDRCEKRRSSCRVRGRRRP
jgi:ABC-type Fe3+ transport system permease subunit